MEDITEGQRDYALNGVAHLEELIRTDGPDFEKARKLLRRILQNCADTADDEGSIGDALAQISKRTKDPLPAVVMLRALAVPGLVPAPNNSNQISRLTVELCESAVPNILGFLRIEKKQQNFEKYEILTNCHTAVCRILTPLETPYVDMDALLNNRHVIIGCLKHTIVEQYAGPFRIVELRSTVDTIFSKLKAVANLSVTLLSDIEDCERAIEHAQADLEGGQSFLTEDFLRPFLTTCRRVLTSFLLSLRGRFSTAITPITSPDRELLKRYPLHEEGRRVQVNILLRNAGQGMATDFRIAAAIEGEDLVLQSESASLGNVQPGEFLATFEVEVKRPCAGFTILLDAEWGEIGSAARKSEVFELFVLAQSGAVDWQKIEYQAPYSTEVAKGDQFVGRADKIRILASKLLRRPMESFYITGQKRIGKTSLALAAAEFARSTSANAALYYRYILWGDFAHADPAYSLRQLGETIEEFLFTHLPEGIPRPLSDYTGSISSLTKIAQLALRVAPQQTFVIIIDEFDEIHQELFLQGNLAETFFANLRALSGCDNICIVLVGGENMPFIMARQGMKLNNFSRIDLSYFSRSSEWADFQLLVRAPTQETLSWQEDGITEIFNATNGNPYFSKLVCASVLRTAVHERDADITGAEVRRAIELEVSSLGANSFAHLWQDGIPKAVGEREPDILRRMRVLVAFTRAIRRGVDPTASNIFQNRALPNVTEGEVQAVLHDFERRGVLREEDGRYSFDLPIFRSWLVDVGTSQLVADALAEELASAALAMENAATVRSDEVVAVAHGWPTYRGRPISSDEIRRWYQQVESPIDQRILFKLLKRTKVYSETLVRERLRSAHAIIRSALPDFVIRKRNERRTDVVVTFIDGEGKSGARFAHDYAEENAIAADCVVSPLKLRDRLLDPVKRPGALIIVDDIAATGQSVCDNLDKVLTPLRDCLAPTKVRIITLVATDTAQAKILKHLSNWSEIDIDFRACEMLAPEVTAFPHDHLGVWASDDEAERARALCTDRGSQIYKSNPLGVGGLGLLLVFPTTVPNNTLPILHSHSRANNSPGWMPLFPRVVN